ncbi:hypothetical protein LX32DRAFT_564597 [Colletotrichum zoysiae]|uniref:Nephrocystin 3-like N-terminal domain-containing protein n=1 Tax=Colletotrichum zoysiae TaxID=1216348 RepID=A0AAD9HFG7_9PEZI|nr:hypothetical protein LX32DRAFT_564597 [Colletotrichum zoysiae]
METSILADGLSGLRAIADATFRLTVCFGKIESRTQTEIRIVANEIQNIAGLLHQLALLASTFGDDPGCNCVSATCLSQLRSCHKTLEHLERSLLKRKADSHLGNVNPKWPFTNAWTRDLLKELNERKEALALGLSAESTSDLHQAFSSGKYALDVDQSHAVSEHISIAAVVATEPGSLDVINFFLKFDQTKCLRSALKESNSLHSFELWKSPEIEKWVNATGSHLWITAPAGAGKTVFAGAMIREAILRRRNHTVVVYVFCSFADVRTHDPVNVLSTIAALVGRHDQAAFKLLQDYYQELHQNKRRSKRPMVEKLKSVLWEMSKFFEHVLVVVDGVDECGSNTVSIVESLASLTSQDEKALRVAIVSRLQENIEKLLGGSFSKVELTHNKNDRQLFTATELERRIFSGDLKFDKAEMKDQTTQKLCLGSETSFWQILCHIDHLSSLQSCEEKMEFLQTLPCSIEATYRLILKGFEKKAAASRDLIQATLLLVAYSNPPLTTQELCQALSTASKGGPESENADMLIYPEIEESEVLSQCGIFIRKSAWNDRIELSHCTVQEFLTSIDTSDPDISDYSLNETRTNQLLAKSALRFLSSEHFSRLPKLSLSEETFIQTRNARFPFYRYAALTWHTLAINLRDDPELLAEAMVLFDPKQTPSFKSWCLEVCRHYVLQGSWNIWRDERDGIEPLRMEVEEGSGFSETTQISDISTNPPLESSGEAASNSDSRANQNDSSTWRWKEYAPRRDWNRGETRRLARIIRRADFTPLHMAALLGIDAVCHELIQRGEDVNRQSKRGTPLQCALGGPFLLACHDMSTQKRPNQWLEQPSRRTVEILIRFGADCTRELPNRMCPWKTMGALSLKASEWARDCELFGLVVRGGAQLYDDDADVFRSICRKWSKTKDEGAFAMIMSILDMLSNMACKKEGESAAYLKAFQKCVSNTTDIDTNLPGSEGISDDMLIQHMWNAIAEDNSEVLIERSKSPRCSSILAGETLTRLLDFAATCSSISCLGYLLTAFVVSDEQKEERSQMVLNCAEHESVDVLVCLLKHGCTTGKLDSGRNTIWHLSAGKLTSSNLLKTLFTQVDRTECVRALRATNKEGRTPLAEALFREKYRNASAIVSQFPGDHDILQSTDPSLGQLIAQINNVEILKELHASNMIRLPTTESPLDSLDDSATVEIVNELLSAYIYKRSETGKTPLEQYLEATAFDDYNKEVLAALIKADIDQTTENAAHGIWEYTCKRLEKTLKQRTADVADTVNLVKIMIEHGCMEMYEKTNGTSGLKEIEALFRLEKSPEDNDNVAVVEDLFVLVLDSTTQRDYLETSGLDAAALHWAIYYDSMFLFDRLLQGGADVCKRKHSLHALEFLCSNGSGPNGYRMLVKMLEKVDKTDLNQLTPSGEGLGLLHRLGIPDGRGINLFGCPTFRSTTAFHNIPPPPPPPPHLGYSRIGTTGFAQARRPLENNKFNLCQRLLREQVDCQVLSSKSHFSPLSTHISAGNVDTAKLILRHGAHQTLHVPDVNGWTPVSWACAHGYVDLLEDMAAACCPEPIWDFQVQVTFATWNVMAQTFNSISALHLAAIASPETVTFLLDRGFATNLDIVAADLYTPLHLATFFGLMDTIKTLVSRGCNINAQTSAGLTPLHISILHQNEPTASLLLELGANHLKTNNGETPLDIAMKKNNKRLVEVVKSSLRKVPTDSTANETERVQRHLMASMSKAMEDAIENHDHRLCERLLNDGCPPDIKTRSCHTCTALVFAFSREKISTKIIDTLIARGASFRVASCARNGLNICSRVRYFDSGSTDLSSDSSTSDSDEDAMHRWPMRGSTCLDYLMCETGHLNKIAAWLRLIPRKDMVWLLDNSIAVQVAIDRNHYKVLEILLSYISELGTVGGRNLVRELVNEVPTRPGRYLEHSPLHDAVEEGQADIARLLLQYGADVNRQNQAQRTPLHTAVQADDLEMVKLLTDHGASLHIRDSHGRTAIELAIYDSSPGMVQFFLDKGASVSRILESDPGLICVSVNMAVSLQKAGINLNQIGSFGIPLWAPMLFKIQLATYILNSDQCVLLHTFEPGRVLWKILWYFYDIDDASSMRKQLRLMYRRLGRDFMRQIFEIEADGKPFNILCFSAHYGLVDEVKFLLHAGCDIEIEGSEDGTALMAAANLGRIEIVKLLVYAGARIHYKTKNGGWTSAVAAAKDFPHVLDWLLTGRFTEQGKIEEPSVDWDSDSEADVCLWSGYWAGVFPLEGKYSRGWGDSMLRWLSCLEKARRHCKGKVVVSHLRDIGVHGE